MKKGPILLMCIIALVAFAAWAPDAGAYSRYNDGCQNCHGAFTDGTSTKGSVFPGGDKHRMHRASANMATDCALCHTSGDNRNPLIGSSDGIEPNVGDVGCVGCHGREADVGNDNISPGRGAGLRQHHENAGESSCATCHDDADPANYTPVGEDLLGPTLGGPKYYGTADTLADEPCNGVALANTNENWTIGDFVGLDNDGDQLYDGDDPDCAPSLEICNNGVDDDGDLLVDCDDQDCQTDPACQIPATETGLCDDGVDNDRDNFTDCADVDCTDDPACAPTTETGLCDDGVDNDGDGDIDCADADCANDPFCAPPPPENCTDGVDNDGDGDIDCADADCANDPVCAPPPPENCTDGVDNDRDSFTDCADQDCANDPVCAPATETGLCDDEQDNDIDGFVDCADPDCANDPVCEAPQDADVFLTKLRAPKGLKLGSRTVSKRIVAVGNGDTIPQDATVNLTVQVNGSDSSVTVTDNPLTQPIEPGANTQFKFMVPISCDGPGSGEIVWTATISAGQNRDLGNDVLTATTNVSCR